MAVNTSLLVAPWWLKKPETDDTFLRAYEKGQERGQQEKMEKMRMAQQQQQFDRQQYLRERQFEISQQQAGRQRQVDEMKIESMQKKLDDDVLFSEAFEQNIEEPQFKDPARLTQYKAAWSSKEANQATVAARAALMDTYTFTIKANPSAESHINQYKAFSPEWTDTLNSYAQAEMTLAQERKIAGSPTVAAATIRGENQERQETIRQQNRLTLESQRMANKVEILERKGEFQKHLTPDQRIALKARLFGIDSADATFEEKEAMRATVLSEYGYMAGITLDPVGKQVPLPQTGAPETPLGMPSMQPGRYTPLRLGPEVPATPQATPTPVLPQTQSGASSIRRGVWNPETMQVEGLFDISPTVEPAPQELDME